MLYLPVSRNVICGLNIPVTVMLNCTEGVFDITFANYGRSLPYSEVCPNPRGPSENMYCYHSIADQFSKCNGVTSCVVPDIQGTTFDPCPGTGKYAQILYFCTSGKVMHHYSDVIWTSWCLKSPVPGLFNSVFMLTTKKASRLCVTYPLWKAPAVDWWIPLTKGQ